MLSLSAQEDALKALDGFCEAFNAVLPRIELLFECEANPFVGNQGEIDLSGTKSGGGGMTHDTPVSTTSYLTPDSNSRPCLVCV